MMRRRRCRAIVMDELALALSVLKRPGCIYFETRKLDLLEESRDHLKIFWIPDGSFTLCFEIFEYRMDTYCSLSKSRPFGH